MNALLRYGFGVLKNTITFARRAIIIFTVFSAVLILFGYFIQKDRPKIDQGKILDNQRQQIYANIDKLAQDTSDTGKIQSLMYRGWLCTTAGEACTDNPEDGNANFQNSLFGKITGWIAAPYANPPASGLAWLNYSLQDAGFIPNTYAATGTGFASIQGYMPIWKLFRDISYLLLVLFILVIGFMIMFRSNAGGQAAVNIESALPRIVIALLIITFSFPVAGFLIDMMYGLIAIAVGLLYDVGGIAQYTRGFDSSNAALSHYMSAGFNDIWPGSSAGGFSTGFALFKLLPPVIQTSLNLFIIPIAIRYSSVLLSPSKSLFSAFNNISAAGFSSGFLPTVGWSLMWLVVIAFFMTWGPGLILGAIIMLTILMFMFRIFFMLLSSYIKILLYIIFAPIILLFSALPGNGNISWWFKNLIGELSAFPTIIVIMLVSNAILAVNINQPEFSALALFGQGSEPSFRLPFLYGFQSEEFNTILSLGLVLIIPDLIKMVKGWIGVQDTPLNFGIGTYFAGAGIFGAGMGAASSMQNLRHTMVGVNYKEQRGLLDVLPGGKAIADRFRPKSP